jgi:hypothetical protein
MSLTSIDVINEVVVKLEDAIENAEIEIAKSIQKAYLTALQEHTSMSDTDIYRSWLIYNSSEANLGK